MLPCWCFAGLSWTVPGAVCFSTRCNCRCFSLAFNPLLGWHSTKKHRHSYLTRHEKGHSSEGHLQGLHLRCTCRLPRVPPSSGAALGRVTGTSFSTSGVRPLSTTPRHFGFVQWPPSFSLFTSLSSVLPILNTKDTRPGVDPICERIHCRKDFQNAQPSYNPGEINQGGEGGA